MTEAGSGATGSAGSPQAGQGASGSTSSPQAGPKTGWQWKPWVEAPAVAATQEEKTLGLVTNLAAFFSLPGLIAVIVIWQVKKDTSRFMDEVGKETLNFQISMIIYMAACVPLMFVLIGIPLAMALGVCYLIFLILAAIKSNEGMIYRFPANLRLIK